MSEHESVFAYKRSLDGVTALVLLNFTDTDVPIKLDLDGITTARLLLSNYDVEDAHLADGITLRGYEGRVYL